MDKAFIEVHADGHTEMLQLSISVRDETGAGSGYRLAGPKFSGQGENLLSRELTADDAADIRRCLDRVYPPENVSGPRYGEPVSEDSRAMYPQEALDAAAAELARRTHGGAADPEDILLASNILSAAFTTMRGQ